MFVGIGEFFFFEFVPRTRNCWLEIAKAGRVDSPNGIALFCDAFKRTRKILFDKKRGSRKMLEFSWSVQQVWQAPLVVVAKREKDERRMYKYGIFGLS